MEANSCASRRDRVLEAVQKSTCDTLDNPSQKPLWIHAGTIADTLSMDRSNVARELNALYRDGKVIKLQGKPTLYICRTTLSQRYPDSFFPSTIPKGSSLQDYIEPQKQQVSQVLPSGSTELDSLVGVDGSLKSAVRYAQAAVMYPGHGLHTLIYGPVGVGKAQFVQKMYDYAVAKGALQPDAPFVTVNCQDHAASPQLLMTQIFGYSREAAPKGEKSRRGLVERAAGGILCLSGVEKLPSDIQDALITLLEKNTFTRIGESFISRSANAMVVAISTEPPNSPSMVVLSQRFPIQIYLPSLRERGVEELTHLLIDAFQKESAATGLNFRITKDVFSCFLKASYYGNLGELSSMVKTCCSLVYLEYAGTLPKPRIMDIGLRHLPPDMLKTIREDSKKDQQVRDLLNSQEFNYFLFTPSGYSTDYLTDSQLFRLLHSSKLKSQESRILPASLTIATEHLRALLESTAQYHVENFHVLQGIFPEEMLNMLCTCADIHAEFSYLRNLPNAMYQLCLCLQAHLSSHLTPIPNGASLLKNLEDACPEEASFVSTLKGLMAGQNMPPLSDTAACLLTACLHASLSLDAVGGVPIMLVCHGQDVATNMASYVNTSLNATVVHGLCFQESMGLDEILDQAVTLARNIDNGNGILLMVDMAPLTELHDHIFRISGIHTETVSNVSLPLLLSISKRALQGNVSLHVLAEEAQAGSPNIGTPRKYSFFERSINEVLPLSLTFINPQKTADVLSTTLTEILNALDLVWSTEVAIKFIFHCSQMMERLITGNPLPYERLKQFINQNSALMNILEQEMQYPSEVFGVSIPACELAYVAEIFLPYLK